MAQFVEISDIDKPRRWINLDKVEVISCEPRPSDKGWKVVFQYSGGGLRSFHVQTQDEGINWIRKNVIEVKP